MSQNQETRPLLLNNSLDPKDSQDDTFSKIEVTKSLISLAIPISFQTAMVYMNQVVNIYFCGYDPDPVVVAGAGLGITYINVAFIAASLGLNGAMQSLVAQSYGAGNHRQCGVYVNRARVVVSIWLPIVILISFFLGSILAAIGINQQTANVAQIYTTRALPGYIALMYFDVARQFLVALGKPLLSTYIQAITGILHVLICYISIVKYELPYYFTAYSTSLQILANFGIIHLILYLDPQYKSSWFIGGKETFQNLAAYAKLAVLSGLLQCFEYAGFEIFCVISGYISVASNAAQVIILTIYISFYQIPLGIMMSNTTIIGQLIGQRKSKLAKAQSSFIIKLNSIFGLITGTIIILLRKQLSRIFSQNDEVIEITSHTLIFAGICHALDFIYSVQAGSIRALTKFNHAVVGGLVAFYVIACPLGCLFALYLKLGVPGIWFGQIIGLFLIAIYFQYLLSWGFDWDLITQQSYERQNEDLQLQLKQDDLLVKNNDFESTKKEDYQAIEQQVQP
ncbi:na+-driven multidrug efflux pump [Stylonychia lemnae]|uniref:Na+-driven multidrug efflux pump n=1 Tax=Stylonychia lemnae TaxID=5949 RepID=A0A078AV86_STYLE|nr:na+-driven multidrug efflux pump [Stylonychia lemnae]|eukprot:CDW85916.1 na+-driven multidrug efflux pump [Stylonychia lemnae]